MSTTAVWDEYQSEVKQVQDKKGLVDLSDRRFRYPYPPTEAPALQLDLQLPAELEINIDPAYGSRVKPILAKLKAGNQLSQKEAELLALAVANHRELMDALICSVDYNGKTPVVLSFPGGIMSKQM